ncbi:hypothetical protein NW767_015714 [Fusarium falciforme]|nr:hypothetical protein NW767_015714 [Fusarium falciforme]
MLPIQYFLPYVFLRQAEFTIDSIQACIDDCKHTSSVVEEKTLCFSLFLLDDFRPFRGKAVYLPQHRTRLNVTLMHNAAARGKVDVVTLLLKLLKSCDVNDEHQDASALSLALNSENFHVAKLLLKGQARPGCGLLINGLHTAARRILRNEIEFFVKGYGFNVDIQDKGGAKPVVHALRLPEDHARETICLLFELEIGEWAWMYFALAKMMRMHTVADEFADRVLEPAEEVSDDDSGCTMAIER